MESDRKILRGRGEKRRLAASLICLGVALIVLVPRVVDSLNQNAVALQITQIVLGRAPLDLAQVKVAGRPREQALLNYGFGLLYQKLGDSAGAELLWSRALQGGEHLLPLIRFWAGASRALAEQASQSYPAQALSWDWLGDVSAAGTPEAALDDYLKAVQIDPGANLVWEKIGALAERLRKPDIASTAYRRACNLNTRRNGSCLSAARLAYAGHDWEATVDYFARGYHPESVTGWVQLITAARKLGRVAEADRYLEQAQADYPADYPKLLSQEP